MNTRQGTFPYAPPQRILEQKLAGDIKRSAVLLGVTPRTVCRWRAGQLLNARNADEAATRLGTHPLLIWPDYHDDLVAVPG